MDPFSLAKKKILVTGASSGIGKSIAQQITKHKGTVIITGRDKVRLDETFDSLKGVNNVSLTADLRNLEDINKLVDNLENLDGVVFCAGVTDIGIQAKMITENQIDEIFNTNFRSQIILYQHLHKKRKINKGASLLFISSITALSAIPTTLTYAASKAAITCSVRILASELSKYSIRVNSISPGLIRTPLLNDMDEESFRNLGEKYPLGLGEPKDVANSSIFLLSDASKWITGIDLIVDGGYILKT